MILTCREQTIKHSCGFFRKLTHYHSTMNVRLFSRFLSFLLFNFLFQYASAQNLNSDFYDGQLWVQINPTSTKTLSHAVDKVELDPIAVLLGKELTNEYGLTRVRKPFHFAIDPAISEVYQLFFSAEGRELEFARELEKLSVVNYAERVPIMRPTLTPNDLGPASGTNDQWGLHRIQAQLAWDITTGNTQVKVAVVDDAVLTTHPDLIPNLLPGYDVADNDADAMPNETGMSHGTHVAGIVSAATNNGLGIASIGFNVKIIPVKSSNSSQFISDAYAGVVWAYQNDADVINMSWGGSGFSQTGQNIINNAYSAGCVNVAAAGNDNVTTIFYPAGYNNVISVASTTTNDAKSGFSNYGTWVDISAPGSAIRSTYFTGNYTPSYADLQGTSMASPMVAGLCGLVKSVNPQMTQTQIENCVLSTADNINSVNGSFIGQLGSGRINAYQAVLCAQTTINAPPIAVINATNTVKCPGGSVQFFGSSIGGLPTTYQWSFPGGNPATSTAQNPIINYPSLGTYNVTLTLTNAFGNDAETLSNFVEVSTNGTDIFYEQDFENGTFAQIGWLLENPDNAATWAVTTVAGSVSGSKAAGINLFNYNATGQRDGLISPVLDFSGHNNIQLDFQHAHRRFSQEFSDSLIVKVSTDGGSTYPFRAFAVAETGTGTFATNGILNQNFVPTNGVDWCFGGDLGSGCFTIDLSNFDGESNVRLKFEIYNDYGNNIYVDNIQLSGNCFFQPEPPIADFSASATAVCSGSSIQFTDESDNLPTGFVWSFPGGTPNSSTQPSPSIVYNAPGTYPVTLTVSNTLGSNQMTQSSYITVNASPNLQLNQTVASICNGESTSVVASGNASSYAWSPATGLSGTSGATVTASPSANTTYTVLASLNGCTSQQTIDVTVNPNPAVPSVISQNQLGFVMLAPASVEGFHAYQAPSAGWGFIPFNAWSVEADMVIARSGATDSLLCTAASNAQSIAGKIAVIYRGTCEFGIKALNAQNAGAVGVIIVNNEAGNATMDMGAGVNGPAVTIPTVMVSQSVGAQLNAAIRSGAGRSVLGQFAGGDLTFCPNESIRLAAPFGYNSYLWSNGDNTAVADINSTGTHQVSVYNEFGCEAQSISFNTSLYAVTQPSIIDNGGTLTSSITGVNYQWYLNGEPLSGATESEVALQGAGNYSVEVTDQNGCITESDPYEVTLVGISDRVNSVLKIWPNPTSDDLFLNLPIDHGFQQLMLFAANGQLIQTENIGLRTGQTIVSMSALAKGIYILRLEGANGIEVHRVVKD